MSNGPLGAETALDVVGLKKSFFRGGEVPVLRGVDLSVDAGEFVSVIGSSGCGKSTLLHLLGSLDRPDEGEIHWRGQRVDQLVGRKRDRFRNETVGFIFQFYHLLPELSAVENVELPQLIRLPSWRYLARRAAIRRRAVELLEEVGLGHRLDHKPRQLSGGEMQRAAIARALMGDPELLLADEPTGNLDSSAGQRIADLLSRLSRQRSLTVLLVTHDEAVARQADRMLRLDQGQLVIGAAAA